MAKRSGGLGGMQKRLNSEYRRLMKPTKVPKPTKKSARTMRLELGADILKLRKARLVALQKGRRIDELQDLTDEIERLTALENELDK